jgi:murein DD-endopeptidase MepM/ murein hydrolase activator NlpD
MSTNQPDDAYTIVIFRGTTSAPLRFSFPRPLVRRLALLALVLAIGEILLLSQYVIKTGEVWELREIRAELLTAKEQTNAFSTAVGDLKRRFLAMKEVNQRLRVMLGLEDLKPEDYLNGQGGGETPISQEEIPMPEGGAAPLLPAEQEGGAPTAQTSAAGEPTDPARQLEREIAWLQNEVVSQERSLEELSQAASERLTRWASTPSVWPVKGWVTSGFGLRISPFTGQPAMHDGLDIGAEPNADIHAPAAGQVTAAGFDPKMGNVVNIDHGYGIQTQYGHMAKILVKPGQKVKRGDRIGLVGSTGLSTGPHLHYMVKVNNRPVNPQRYILQ